jgi:hypothetical protein
MAPSVITWSASRSHQARTAPGKEIRDPSCRLNLTLEPVCAEAELAIWQPAMTRTSATTNGRTLGLSAECATPYTSPSRTGPSCSSRSTARSTASVDGGVRSGGRRKMRRSREPNDVAALILRKRRTAKLSAHSLGALQADCQEGRDRRRLEVASALCGCPIPCCPARGLCPPVRGGPSSAGGASHVQRYPQRRCAEYLRAWSRP